MSAGRVLIVVLICLALAACSLPGEDCTQPEVLCVGLVTNTAGLGDYGLNQSAWEGVQRAVADGVIQKADVIESVDARDYGKNLATFAVEGYDLVIASGQGLSNETIEQARLHPKTGFLGLAQEAPDEPVDNLGTMEFHEEQGGFLAGVLAAKTSQTGVVGAVCETSDIEAMRLYCEGFREGASFENEQVEVLVTYHETEGSEDLFRDETWGSETAAFMVSKGADVLFGVGGRLGQGVLRRAAEAEVWSIGAERDQYYVTREARQWLLASAVPAAGESIYQFLVEMRDGKRSTAPNGGMILSPYHEGEGFIPLSVQAYLMQLQAEIQGGRIDISIEREP